MANANYLITMPDIGEGIAEVEIVEWSVKVGQTVEEDDLLCVVMTDKANVEIPSPVDGEVVWLGADVGDVMAVGADFIRLVVEQRSGNLDSRVKEQDDVSQSEQAKADSPAEPDDPNTDAEKSLQDVTQNTAPLRPANNDGVPFNSGLPRPEGEKPLAPPAVRQRARNAGIDLRLVIGTGPANRISHTDLDDFIAGASRVSRNSGIGLVANTKVDEIEIVGLRRRIASIMQDTMQRIPHFTYVEEVDVTELELLRLKLNRERSEDKPKLTLLPFFIKALVKAIAEFPEMNANFDDKSDTLYRYGAAHIGIATQTPAGLVVPVLRHAEVLSIWQSAEAIKRLSSVARDGKATRDELSGSTITVSSLGPMGGIVTTPVINSPEVAILGINKIAKRPVWNGSDFVARDIMNISSSFDHRLIDGWEATLFVQAIKGLLESPAELFIEDQ